MIFVKNFLLLIISSLALSACGGGDSFKVSHALDGKWTTGCSYDADVNLAEHNIFTINGRSFSRDASIYNTSDCSGAALEKVIMSADIDYVGTQNTSTCVAEKTNVSYNKIVLDGRTLSEQEFSQFLQDANLPNPEYDIACVNSNRLWLGDFINGNDGSSADRRPTTIDLSGSATRI